MIGIYNIMFVLIKMCFCDGLYYIIVLVLSLGFGSYKRISYAIVNVYCIGMMGYGV